MPRDQWVVTSETPNYNTFAAVGTPDLVADGDLSTFYRVGNNRSYVQVRP